MILKFTIPTNPNKKIPDLNDYIRAERTRINTRHGGFFTLGGKMKKEWQRYISVYIRKDIGKQKVNKPFIIHYHYFEVDRRRDIGNIHATTQKWVEDALQDVGTIPNDNQTWLRGFTAKFDVDKKFPRIEVELEELED